MTAAELLRDLDKRATGAPWESRSGAVSDFGRLWPASLTMEWLANGMYDVDASGDELPEGAEDVTRKHADARLIATTRNLLPQLAALVEAVGAYAEARDAMNDAIVIGRDGEDAIDALNVVKWSAHDAMLTALSALNAAAKEQA